VTADPVAPTNAPPRSPGHDSTPLRRAWRRLLGDEPRDLRVNRGNTGPAQHGDGVDRAAGDVAALLRSFAASVIVMHEDAQRRAVELVASAEAHARDVVDLAYRRADRITMEADARLAQADAVLREARARANAIVSQAQQVASGRGTTAAGTVVPLAPRGEGKVLGR